MKLTTVGTGKAIHLYVEDHISGQHFENSACVAAKSKYTQLDVFEGEVTEVTCKRCQNSAAFQEASQPEIEEGAPQPEVEEEAIQAEDMVIYSNTGNTYRVVKVEGEKVGMYRQGKYGDAGRYMKVPVSKLTKI